MDFKQYYRQQELLEFTGGGAISNIAQAAGKAVGGAFNLMGAGVKALAGGVVKVMKDMVAKVREPLKKKWDAVIKLAEEIYPYDKEIYEQLKADKNTAIREIDTYLEMTSKKTLPTKYSVGLDIVYRTYALTLAKAYGMDKEIPAPKLSIKTLEDAKNKVKNVQFPKMKDSNAVTAYFDTYVQKDSSTLKRWIDTASVYCIWKNKYSKIDEEGQTTIVDQIQDSNLLNSQSPNTINEKMKDLEDAVPAKEVNVKNLEDTFKADISEKTAEVSTIIDEDSATIKKTLDMKVDPQSIEFLTVKFVNISAKAIANNYITMSRLIQKYNSQASIMTVFQTHTSFHDFFAVVSDPELKKIYSNITSRADKQTLMNNFVNLNADGMVVNSKRIIITDELASDINKLFGVIKPSNIEVAQTKPEAQQTPQPEVTK